MPRRTLTLEEKLNAGKEASRLYKEIGNWRKVGKILGVNYMTARRYAFLFEQGGEELIIATHHEGKKGQAKVHSNRGKNLGTVREAPWIPEFRYSELWNQVLFNRDMTNLINGRV